MPWRRLLTKPYDAASRSDMKGIHMTRSHSIIPFHDLVFHDEMPRPHAVEERLRKSLRAYRLTRQELEIEEGRLSPDDAVARHELLDDNDRSNIKRYVERVEASSGMQHLSAENRVRLGPLQGGLPIARVETEHEADEIASALHTEMPWMARATEEVWHGLRASARDGLPGGRFNPLVLVGSPGIGKSYWARRLAHHLAIPTTKIEATGEPANFSLIGSQKGWNNASPGKLVATVLRERHAGPLVIVDEIEKVGSPLSPGSTHGADGCVASALGAHYG